MEWEVILMIGVNLFQLAFYLFGLKSKERESSSELPPVKVTKEETSSISGILVKRKFLEKVQLEEKELQGKNTRKIVKTKFVVMQSEFQEDLQEFSR